MKSVDIFVGKKKNHYCFNWYC